MLLKGNLPPSLPPFHGGGGGGGGTFFKKMLFIWGEILWGKRIGRLFYMGGLMIGSY